MKDFFKYLAPAEQDVQWGLYLNVAGKAFIPPGAGYPPPKHPAGYSFTWERGRVLDEYQINYITQGGGLYENNNGRFPVKAGSLMITKPGVWHRYHPDPKTGWEENYIGFNGAIAALMLDQPVLAPMIPVVNVGNRGELIDTYFKIYEFVIDEHPGFQQVAAGMVMKLLGYLVSFDKQKDFSQSPVEKIIRKACFVIRENLDKEVDFQKFADDENIPYARFRRMFKKYTGMPPVQYHLHLKIMRSRELLLSTEKMIKEISWEMGFQSVYYYSRVFKKIVGISPSELRNNPAKFHRNDF